MHACLATNKTEIIRGTSTRVNERSNLHFKSVLLTTEAMEAHFFTPGIKFDDAQILSSAASVRVSSEAVQILWVQLSFCRDELRFCGLNSVSVEKSELPWPP